MWGYKILGECLWPSVIVAFPKILPLATSLILFAKANDVHGALQQGLNARTVQNAHPFPAPPHNLNHIQWVVLGKHLRRWWPMMADDGRWHPNFQTHFQNGCFGWASLRHGRYHPPFYEMREVSNAPNFSAMASRNHASSRTTLEWVQWAAGEPIMNMGDKWHFPYPHCRQMFWDFSHWM